MPYKLSSYRTLVFSMLSLLSLISSGKVLAQIDELVITAQKREASIQDTAIAVSAFDSSALETAGIDDALDIQFSVPNVLYSKGNFTDSNMSIRGIGTSAVGVSADSGTGVHINGMYLNSPQIFETEFYDVERVEMLRGPQGTLYGRNTTAGVMNVITAKPDDEFGADISVTGGNYSTGKVKGMVNIPMGDVVSERIAGFYLTRDGYVDNLYTNNKIDDRELYAIRSTTQFNFSDIFDATLMLEKFREDDNRSRVSKQQCIKDPDGILGCLPTGLGYEVTNAAAGVSAQIAYAIGLSPPGTDQFANSYNPDDMRKVYADFDPQYFVENTTALLEFNLVLGDLTLTSLTGYQGAQFNAKTDYDWTVPSSDFLTPVVGFYNGIDTQTVVRDSPVDESSNDNDQVSQEFRVVSDYGGAFNFTAGLFAMQYENENHYTIYFPVGYQYGQLFALPEEQSIYDNHTKHYAVETWALFGEGYWDFTDDTKLTLGLRYTDESKEVDQQLIYLNFRAGLDDPFIHQENDWQEWTGKIGIDSHYELGEAGDALLFATLSRGYKGGGFNPPGNVAFADTFDPEYVNAFEFGAKSNFFSNTFQANMSVFYYDYIGLQVSKIIEQTSINENVDSTISGIEGEFIYAPNENWRLGLNLAYLNAEIGDFQTFDPTDPAQTGSAAGVITVLGSNYLAADPTSSGIDIDLEGNQLPNSPEFSVNFNVEYSFYFDSGFSLSPRIQYYWQDDFYSRIFNTKKDNIDSWSVIDLQLTLRSPTEDWSLQAWVKNVNDDDFVTGHYTGDAASGLYTNVFVLEPRTFGVTFDYHF